MIGKDDGTGQVSVLSVVSLPFFSIFILIFLPLLVLYPSGTSDVSAQSNDTQLLV